MKLQPQHMMYLGAEKKKDYTNKKNELIKSFNVKFIDTESSTILEMWTKEIEMDKFKNFKMGDQVYVRLGINIFADKVILSAEELSKEPFK
jgi:hypothetical protein